MSRAIGMIEFKTTPAGITAADAMVKTSEVEIVEAQTVCPGKYIAIITGDLSAVKAAVDTAVTTYEDKCIDSFVLGNPHESIFPAIYGTTQVEEISALGILETYDAASIIEAADQAAKTAIVDLIELRIAKGMCGKSYMLLTGEVSAVEASIERAKELVAEKGMYMDHTLIYEENTLRPKTLEALDEEGFHLVKVPFRPTAENFSEYFFRKMKEKGYPVKRAVVYETPNNCAAYRETEEETEAAWL